MNKKIIISIMLSLSIFSSSYWWNYSYTSVDIYSQVIVKNTDKNIEIAKILAEILTKYKEAIKKKLENNNLKLDNYLINNFDEIDVMISSLKKIQIKQIDKNIAEDIIKSVIYTIKNTAKNINSYIKKNEEYLKVWKYSISDKYKNFTIDMSNKIDILVNEFEDYLEVAHHIDEIQKKSIKNSVEILKEQKEILKNFSRKSYDDKNIMKKDFLKIINNLRVNLSKISKLLDS